MNEIDRIATALERIADALELAVPDAVLDEEDDVEEPGQVSPNDEVFLAMVRRTFKDQHVRWSDVRDAIKPVEAALGLRQSKARITRVLHAVNDQP